MSLVHGGDDVKFSEVAGLDNAGAQIADIETAKLGSGLTALIRRRALVQAMQPGAVDAHAVFQAGIRQEVTKNTFGGWRTAYITRADEQDCQRRLRIFGPVHVEDVMSITKAILKANAGFYRAFAERDMALMEKIWASAHPVTCVHPGWQPIAGRDRVLNSWRDILLGPSPPAIACIAPEVSLLDACALVVCYESVGNGFLVATNGFVLEANDWRLVLHHAGPVAEPPQFANAPASRH
jgi:hypothetical protein